MGGVPYFLLWYLWRWQVREMHLYISQIASEQWIVGPMNRSCFWVEIGLCNVPLIFFVFPIAVAHAGCIVFPFILLYIGLDCGRVHIR